MAGHIPEQAIQEIKRKTSLAALIGEHVKLKKAGNSYKGLCPFHGEKSPSFHVHDDTGYYYCFGCQAKGDAISFLTQYVGYAFPEAVRLLAEQAGVELPEEDVDPTTMRRNRERRAQKDRFADVNATALQCFRQWALSSEEARAYLDKRGIDADTAERFAIGFVADEWDMLSRALAREGFTALRDAQELGLIAPRKSGSGHYDKFRHRLIFPVRDPLSRDTVQGFAGRTLSSDSDAPKYVNSSESVLFEKGKCLYGLFEAKRQLREHGRAIVVEGQVDVLTLARAGFAAVAPMGTALTSDQCRLLQRFAKQAILVYDGDGAGRAAAIKAIPLLLRAGLTGRVVVLPDGEDPDTLVRNSGAEALEELIAGGKALFEHFVDVAMADYDGSEAGKAAVVEQVGPVYALLKSEPERDRYARGFAQTLGVLEADAQRWLRAAASRSTPRPSRTTPSRAGATGARAARPPSGRSERPPRVEAGPVGPPAYDEPPMPEYFDGPPGPEAPMGPPMMSVGRPPSGKAPQPERDLLGILLRHPELIPFWQARQAPDALTHGTVRAIVSILEEQWDANQRLDMMALFEQLEARQMGGAARRVAVLQQAEDPYGDEFQAAFVQIADQLEKDAVERATHARLVQLSPEEQLAFGQKHM